MGVPGLKDLSKVTVRTWPVTRTLEVTVDLSPFVPTEDSIIFVERSEMQYGKGALRHQFSLEFPVAPPPKEKEDFCYIEAGVLAITLDVAATVTEHK